MSESYTFTDPDTDLVYSVKDGRWRRYNEAAGSWRPVRHTSVPIELREAYDEIESTD